MTAPSRFALGFPFWEIRNGDAAVTLRVWNLTGAAASDWLSTGKMSYWLDQTPQTCRPCKAFRDPLGAATQPRTLARPHLPTACLQKDPGRSRGNKEIRDPALSILVVQVGSLKVGSLIEVVLAIVTIRCGPAAGVVPPIGPRSALLPIALLPASLLTALIVFPLWGTHEAPP